MSDDRAIALIALLNVMIDKLDRIESHLYHIEVHCRPERDESEEEPASKRERTL
jgi:hypothetical protein